MWSLCLVDRKSAEFGEHSRLDQPTINRQVAEEAAHNIVCSGVDQFWSQTEQSAKSLQIILTFNRDMIQLVEWT